MQHPLTLPELAPEDFNTFYDIRRSHLPYAVHGPYHVYHFQDFDLWVCTWPSYAGKMGSGIVAFATIAETTFEALEEYNTTIFCNKPWQKQYSVQSLPLNFPWSHRHILPLIAIQNGDLKIMPRAYQLNTYPAITFMALITVFLFYGFEKVRSELRGIENSSGIPAPAKHVQDYYAQRE